MNTTGWDACQGRLHNSVDKESLEKVELSPSEERCSSRKVNEARIT